MGYAPGQRPVPRERHEENAGDRLMHSLGFSVIRLSQTRATQQTPGIPDRRYYHPELGEAFWWEAKRSKGGRQSPAQREFQRLCEATGDVYVLGDFEALVDYCVSRDWVGRFGAGHLMPGPVVTEALAIRAEDERRKLRAKLGRQASPAKLSRPLAAARRRVRETAGRGSTGV